MNAHHVTVCPQRKSGNGPTSPILKQSHRHSVPELTLDRLTEDCQSIPNHDGESRGQW